MLTDLYSHNYRNKARENVDKSRKLQYNEHLLKHCLCICVIIAKVDFKVMKE